MFYILVDFHDIQQNKSKNRCLIECLLKASLRIYEVHSFCFKICIHENFVYV